MLWNKRATRQNDTGTDKGKVSEQFAEQFLVKQGLSLIDKNYHCRQGEVDLIMLDGDTYVFIEVKYRKSKAFGGALAAIPLSKQQKVKHCVTFYLHQAGLNEYNTPCRIDVVALEGDISHPQVTWIKNAF
ncbi:YraN family protein [Colwellia sp. TT2012]|uniref:YraN family protein n=1 Tax=Colwellia sp. TT2012 TaxID=1720342 RepID=UPI00070D3D9E|nr:YraN family protein [Colwellia sp. TT2012]